MSIPKTSPHNAESHSKNCRVYGGNGAMEMLAQFSSCSGLKNHIQTTICMALDLEQDLEFGGWALEGCPVWGVTQRRKEDCLKSSVTSYGWVWLKMRERAACACVFWGSARRHTFAYGLQETETRKSKHKISGMLLSFLNISMPFQQSRFQNKHFNRTDGT